MYSVSSPSKNICEIKLPCMYPRLSMLFHKHIHNRRIFCQTGILFFLNRNSSEQRKQRPHFYHCCSWPQKQPLEATCAPNGSPFVCPSFFKAKNWGYFKHKRQNVDVLLFCYLISLELHQKQEETQLTSFLKHKSCCLL